MYEEYSVYLMVLLAIGLLSGCFAGLVTRGSGFGFIGNTVTAMAGAFAAFYIGGSIGDYFGLAGSVVIGFCGAFLALWLIALIRR